MKLHEDKIPDGFIDLVLEQNKRVLMKNTGDIGIKSVVYLVAKYQC